MALSTGNPPNTPVASLRATEVDMATARALRKGSGTATPSKLRQVLLDDMANRSSLVTDTDFILASPSKGGGGDGTGSLNNLSGTKRPRTDDSTNEDDADRSVSLRHTTTECYGQVARIVANDERLYDAKMRLF